MKFYFLHNKKNKPKSVRDFKYIYYIQGGLKKQTKSIKFTNEPDIIYYPHEINGVLKWDYDDKYIDILGHENSVLVRFQKICDYNHFELWINTEYLEQ